MKILFAAAIAATMIAIIATTTTTAFAEPLPLPRPGGSQAQQDVLTLACSGTVTNTPPVTEDKKPSQVSMGLIVNLTARTIQGFNSLLLGDPPDEITEFNDATIMFLSKREDSEEMLRIFMGSIDRVTGDLKATATIASRNPPQNRLTTTYSLNCRPAQRLF